MAHIYIIHYTLLNIILLQNIYTMSQCSHRAYTMLHQLFRVIQGIIDKQRQA